MRTVFNHKPNFLLKKIWRIDTINKLPSLNKKIVNVTSLDDIEGEKKILDFKKFT